MNQTFGAFVHCSSCFVRHNATSERPVPTPVGPTPSTLDVGLVALPVLAVMLLIVNFWPSRR